MKTLPLLVAGLFATLAPGQADIGALIDELRSDDVKWNASGAASRLRRLPEPPIRALRDALDSDDWQQRQYALNILWRLAEPHPLLRREPVGEITPRMLAVAVEGLARDEHHAIGGGRADVAMRNAAEGFRRLIPHARAARPYLEKGLASRDSQQRLLSAMVLGYGGVSESAPRAARVLLPHLRDNRIQRDATFAVGALYGLGPAVRPSLLTAMAGADEQQSKLIRLVLLDLETPPRTQGELEDRLRLNPVTRMVFDPAVQGPPGDTMSWLWSLPE
jgi:hypothetical protein